MISSGDQQEHRQQSRPARAGPARNSAPAWRSDDGLARPAEGCVGRAARRAPELSGSWAGRGRAGSLDQRLHPAHHARSSARTAEFVSKAHRSRVRADLEWRRRGHGGHGARFSTIHARSSRLREHELAPARALASNGLYSWSSKVGRGPEPAIRVVVRPHGSRRLLQAQARRAHQRTRSVVPTRAADVHAPRLVRHAEGEHRPRDQRCERHAARVSNVDAISSTSRGLSVDSTDGAVLSYIASR